MMSIHLLSQNEFKLANSQSHINICSFPFCQLKSVLEQNLNALDGFSKRRFFWGSRESVGKSSLFSLSTVVCIAVVLISLFFISPAFAVDSLVKPQAAIATPDVTASILKVSAGLLLVIFAIFGSAWFFRRFGGFSPTANDSLKVIGGLTLGQKEKIVLLQVGEEQVLIGVAPGNIQKLHVLEKPIKLNEETDKETKPFSESLGDALGKWKNK